MTDEQHLLDVIVEWIGQRRTTQIGSLTYTAGTPIGFAQDALAALREAIAEDPERVNELLPEGWTAFPMHPRHELWDKVKLGRAVEATPDADGHYGPAVESERVRGWDACLDAIYTDAGIER